MRARFTQHNNDSGHQSEGSGSRDSASRPTFLRGWRRRNHLFSILLLAVIALRLAGPSQTALPDNSSPTPTVHAADWVDDLLQLLKEILGGGG